MAGLARVQQRFNAAVVAVLVLAGLRGIAGANETAEGEAALGHGHPIHAKFLKRSNPRSNRPGYPFPGYCNGLRYRSNGNGKQGRHQ